MPFLPHNSTRHYIGTQWYTHMNSCCAWLHCCQHIELHMTLLSDGHRASRLRRALPALQAEGTRSSTPGQHGPKHHETDAARTCAGAICEREASGGPLTWQHLLTNMFGHTHTRHPHIAYDTKYMSIHLVADDGIPDVSSKTFMLAYHRHPAMI